MMQILALLLRDDPERKGVGRLLAGSGQALVAALRAGDRSRVPRLRPDG